MSYLGDYVAGDIIDFKFNTRAASSGTAVPFALASGAVQVWKSNSTEATTAGVTLTSTFASVTGLNHCRIESTSDSTFFANGGQFEAYLSAGTVNSVSVAGELVGRFTLRAQASLYPTVSGRQLDVSAGGEAGVDWANVGSPTTTLGLTGTTIKTATDVETDTADIQSRIGTPSDLGGGATIAANLSDIEAQTDDIGAAGAGLTAIPWNASWDAEVQSEVADALDDSIVLRRGTAQAGAAGSITLDAGASATGDLYNSLLVSIVSGTGAGQMRLILDYNGTTKVADVTPNWTTNPDATSEFRLLADGRSNVSLLRGSLPNPLLAGRIDANMQAAATGVISADALAADAANEIADALLDRSDAVEAGLTVRQAHRLEAAAAAGKLSGAATTTVTIRNAVADSKDRVTATVDADGNRSAVTTDLT